MVSQEVEEDLILLAQRAVEALRRANSAVSSVEASNDVTDDDVVMEDQEPSPTREEISQLIPALEVPYTSREGYRSSMMSSETDSEAIQSQHFHVQADVNDRPGPAAIESAEDVTQTDRKPINQISFAPLGRYGDRPSLLRNAIKANGIREEIQSIMDEVFGNVGFQINFTPSWNDRVANALPNVSNVYRVPGSKPLSLKQFAFKQNFAESTRLPRYPSDGNSSQSAPLPLEAQVESAHTIRDASRSYQNGTESKEQTRFIIKDGKYVSPEYMKGVPVAKLDEGGQYWRESWPTIEGWIKGSTAPWVQETVKFWKAYSIHPNQLISIKYYDGLGLCSAEVPRVLQQTLEDLEAAGVPDPVQWLRERLGELIMENCKDGEKHFALKSVLKKFRLHDSAFRPYYRSGRTLMRRNPGPNVAQATSAKRRHIAGLETSPRPHKKHAHNTSGDHATL